MAGELLDTHSDAGVQYNRDKPLPDMGTYVCSPHPCLMGALKPSPSRQSSIVLRTVMGSHPTLHSKMEMLPPFLIRTESVRFYLTSPSRALVKDLVSWYH